MVKIKHILIFLVLSKLAICMSQPVIKLDTNCAFWGYYQTINLAEKFNVEKDYQAANVCYEKAFGLVKKPFKVDYYLAAINAAHFDKEICKKYLNEAINLGLTYEAIRSNKQLDTLFSGHDKRELKKRISNTNPDINLTIFKQVKKMVFIDQHVARAFWTDWLSWERQCKIMDKYDPRNAKKLMEICRQTQWPGFSTIGEISDSKYYISDVSILIQHLSKEHLDSLFPYMIDAVENGEMYPFQLARCVDYHYMITDNDSAEYRIFTRQTIYGTFTQGEGNFHVPFGKIDSVNFYRKNAGLEPIEEYAQKRNTIIPNFEKDFMRVVRAEK